MTSSRRVDCADVEALLNLEVTESRPDRRLLMEHLEVCSQCRSRAPELVWFYGSLNRAGAEGGRIVSPRRTKRVVALLACVLLPGLVVFALCRPGTGVPPEEPASAASEELPSRVLPEHYSTVEVTSTQAAPAGATSSMTRARLSSVGAHGERRPGAMEWIR